MRYIINIFLILVLGLIFTTGYADNLVKNADFSQVQNGKPIGWNIAKGWKGKSEYKFENGVCTIVRKDNDGGAGACFSDKIEVEALKKYEVAVKMRIAGIDGRYNILLDFYDNTGKMFKRQKLFRCKKNTSNKFVPHKTRIIVPEHAETVKIGLVINRRGTVTFKNIFLGIAKELSDKEIQKTKRDALLYPQLPPTSKFNLYPNADFSEKNDGFPKYWSVQKSWKYSKLYNYSMADGALVISGGAEKQHCGAFACRPLRVTAGTWYHLSAEIGTENMKRYAAVILQFLDVSGKVISSRRFITCWRSNQEFLRRHNVFQTPPGTIWLRTLAVLYGSGTAKFKNFSLNGNFSDRSDNSKSCNLILNSSFEEADFAPDFTDCFETLTGSARRISKANHGYYGLELSPGTSIGYGKNIPAISVQGNKILYANFAVSGNGSLTFKLDFYDINGRKCGTEEKVLKTQSEKFVTLPFSLKTPQNAKYAKLTLHSGRKGTVTVDSLYLGQEPFRLSKLPLALPVVGKPVQQSNLSRIPRSTIENYQGIPTWHIDGKPVVNSLYTVERVRKTSSPGTLRYHKNVIAKGKFSIYVIGGPININETGPRSINEALANADFQIRLVLSECPDAKFVIWCHQYISMDFADKYPGELAKVEDDSCGFRRAVKKGYSYGSEIWGRLCAQSLQKFICRIRNRTYGDRIVGIIPGFGQYGENNWGHIAGKYYTSPHDFSPAMTNFFRKWLFREYRGQVKEFDKAWKKKNFNFANAQVPNMLQRVPRLKGGFLDPVVQRQVIDYARCDSYSIIHRVLQQCRAIKEITGGKMFTMSELGYLALKYNHREMMEALKSPYLDSWGPAPGYTNRGPGDDVADNAPTGSLRYWNKIFMFQADVRSHLTGSSIKRFGDTANSDESVAVYLRDIGHYMTTGAIPYHWTFGQWYRDEKIMKVVAEFDKFMQLSGKFPRQSRAEVALVLDSLSLSTGIEFNYNRRPNTAAAQISYNRFLEWHKLGAPYDIFMLDDLLASPDLKQYKVVIMGAVCTLSERQRQLIAERLQQDGRTIIWMYAPGIVRATGSKLIYDPANMAVTGFHIGEDSGKHLLGIKLTSKALTEYGLLANYGIAGNFRSPIYGGFGCNPKNPKPLPPEKFSTRFYVKPAPELEILGKYADSSLIAAAKYKQKSHTSIFWGSTALECSVLRPILRNAGVHLYSDRPAVVYVNENFLVIHTSSSGKYTINLPRKVEIVYNLFTDKVIAGNTDHFTVNLPAKRSLLVYFGKHDALKKAKAEVDAAIEARDRYNARLKPRFAFNPVIRNLARKADIGGKYSPDSNGFIRHWLFVGPFPNCGKDGGYTKDFLRDEKNIRPSSGMVYDVCFDATLPGTELERNSWYNGKKGKKSFTVKWHPIEFSKGITKNIAQEITLPFKDRVVYYCACYIESPKAGKAILAVGSDDGNKTFFNGIPATAINIASRSLSIDSEKYQVDLKAGKNILLLKIIQGKGALGHAVRFIDPATKKPITNLTITLHP